MHRAILLLLLLLLLAPAPLLQARVMACQAGRVWADTNANARIDPDERGIAGVKLSDGEHVVVTDAAGHYSLPAGKGAGRTSFVIKPVGYELPRRGDGLPAYWTNESPSPQPKLRYGGMTASPGGSSRCADFALHPQDAIDHGEPLDVLLFADTQTKSSTDVGYYRRDIIEPLVGKHQARLGLTLGDVVNDDLALYPQLNEVTRKLGIPWLHIAGNHDLDFDAPRDEESLLTFRNTYGPDTFAWEEARAVFIGLDDVVYRPGRQPAYIGGLREGQFAFLESYLPTLSRDRLLVVAIHIPLFDARPGVETFRHADRARLFALLESFPNVLVLSGHSHTQQHVYHGADEGWSGSKPLHEYNVGAACGAFWSGAKDAAGIPDATMSDGTPNGHASLRIDDGGSYSLAWHPARDPEARMALHAPMVLRQGAYPAWGVYANVFMGDSGTRVEYRVDGGDWKPMKRVEQPDPRLLAENARDDAAEVLRGYDRSPEAVPSTHLWRGALPTDLAIGEHSVEVQAWDRDGVPQHASTAYRLQVASP